MSSWRRCSLVTGAACAASLMVTVPAGSVTGTRAAAAAAATPSTDSHREMSAIVHAWSARLNAGDNDGIARLFALPALIVQSPYEYRLTTRHQVALWHSGLPCSGTVLSISYQGRFATAIFRLGNRAGSTCDQPGGLAAARFEIANGKIRSWVQIAVPPGGQSGPIA